MSSRTFFELLGRLGALRLFRALVCGQCNQFMMPGKQHPIPVIRCFGSGALSSLEPRVAGLRGLLHLAAPAMASSTNQVENVWHMNKTQLLAKALNMGITTHPSWSVGELRQLIQEKKKAMGHTSDIPKGLGSMNKTQLLEQCRILGLEVPEKATNGLLTLMIRDSCTKNKGDAVVTFGRHRGKLYKEVPRSYLEWAIQEVRERGPEGSSPDLVSLSTYAAQILQDKGAYHRDPEETAVVPIPPESSSASSWSEVWSELTPPARELNMMVEHTNKPKSQMPVPGYKDSKRTTPTKRTPDRSEREGAGIEKMNQDVPPGVQAEVEDLMARLASLRDKYNL